MKHLIFGMFLLGFLALVLGGCTGLPGEQPSCVFWCRTEIVDAPQAQSVNFTGGNGATLGGM